MLERWPFATVPNQARAALWIGRPELLVRLKALLASWRRRRASDITVLWADFGQGKTHALMHVQSELSSVSSCLVHYVQLPPLTTGSPFVALYRQVMRDFPLELLGRRVFERYKDQVPSLFTGGTLGDRQIHQLLWLVGTSSPGKDIALRWFRGDRVGPNELKDLVIGAKRLAISSAPSTAQDCQNVLDSLLNLSINFPVEDEGEFVLLIDEFQRVGELTAKKRTEVCDALHLLFNRRPQGFRLVLAFAGGLPEIVTSVLTRDLQARITNRLNLPPMTKPQGEKYFTDLVNAYIGPHEKFPYETQAIDFIVHCADPTGMMLSPRKINITADALSNAALTIRDLQGASASTKPFTVREMRDAYASVGDELETALDVAE